MTPHFFALGPVLAEQPNEAAESTNQEFVSTSAVRARGPASYPDGFFIVG